MTQENNMHNGWWSWCLSLISNKAKCPKRGLLWLNQTKDKLCIECSGGEYAVAPSDDTFAMCACGKPIPPKMQKEIDKEFEKAFPTTIESCSSRTRNVAGTD